MGAKNSRDDMIVFSICIVCLISIFVSVIVNAYSISSSSRSKAEARRAEFSVTGTDFEESGKCVVDGVWEYYDGVHLISDGVKKSDYSKLVELPMRWSMFSRDSWGSDGKASYRILLTALPEEDLVFCLYGISPRLEVFVDGEHKSSDYYNFGRALEETAIRGVDSCEIVIEVSSDWLTGIYACPWLYRAALFQRDMNLANSIWMVSLGAFVAAFLLCAVLLRKFRVRKLYRSFAMSFVVIALFYAVACNEMTAQFQYIYEYVSFEQMHLMVTAIAVFTGYVTLRLQAILFPAVYEKKISYLLSGALYAAMFLRLIFEVYFDVDVVIGCLLAVFIVYETVCTFLGLRSSGKGMGFIAAATIMVNIAISVATFASAKHFFVGIYIILPSSLLIAILLYANFWALEFAKIEAAAANESLSKQKLMDAEIAYLTSQVQPHFQYNTLTMIQELCYTDPEKAAQAIVMYSSLLRRKVDFNKYAKLVTFSDELESIREYAEIQKLRFGDTIDFRFNVAAEDFQVPPLAIQTLVENAVHHGLRKKTDGGIMSLDVRQEKSDIIIRVIDNGVGFDPELCNTERVGSGIENCRFRVESLLGGSVRVKSAIDWGTCVTVTIPVRRKRNAGARSAENILEVSQ